MPVLARIAPSNKICVVFDSLQTNNWLYNGQINFEGLGQTLKYFLEAGIHIDDISFLNLADVYGKPKAQQFKDKDEYVKEIITTCCFNVLVPVGAEAFNRIVGWKGLQKYVGKALYSDIYPNQKVVPIQNPIQARYDPTVGDNIASTMKLIKEECGHSELIEKVRLPTNYALIDTMEKFDQWYDYYMAKVKAFAYDTETKSFSFNSPNGRLLCLSFSHKPGFAYLLPTNFYDGYWTEEEYFKIKCCLRRLFGDESKLLIGHNIKYDNKWIYHHLGIPVRRHNFFDTMVAAFLCNENTPNDLKYCAMRYTDMGDYEFELQRWIDNYCEKSKPKVKKTDFTYDLVPFDILSKYAQADADATFRLYLFFKEELVRENQVKVFEMVNNKFVYLLTKIEINGWPIDVEYGEKLSKQLQEEIEKVEAKLREFPEVKAATKIAYQCALDKENLVRKTPTDILPKSKWQGFKFSSNHHKRILFYEVLRLPIIKYTKAKDEDGKRTTPAVDRECLEDWFYNFPEKGEFLETLQYFGELNKIKSTYVDGILSKVVNGRIHPTYNTIGAKTGRISCKDPNFQNLPARPRKPHFIEKLELVKLVKKMVKAPKDRVLLGADMAAIEMRWACIVSGDKKLEEIFNTHGLIHESITKELFPYITCDLAQVKALYEFERNSIAKRVQFLSLYGGGAETLAKGVNIENRNRVDEKGNKLSDDLTEERAQEILDNYFAKYSGVKQCIDDTTRFIEKNGYSLSVFGRKRRIPEVNAEDMGARARAIRQGVNSIFQSPASDSLLLALYEFQVWLEDNSYDFKQLGPCHDAGYGETAEECKLEAKEIFLKFLETPPFKINIPLEADCEWGVSWADFSKDFGNELLKEEEDDEEELENEAA